MARGTVDAVDVPEPETIPAMVGLLCVLVVIFALWRKR